MRVMTQEDIIGELKKMLSERLRVSLRRVLEERRGQLRAAARGLPRLEDLDALPRQWASEQPNFTYVPVLSDATPADAWAGRTGFVHLAVMADLPDLSAHQVYACGVPVVVNSAKRDFVATCGLPEDQFFADAFTSEADKAQ